MIKDSIDDWSHLENNEIPNTEGGSFEYPVELLLRYVKPELLFGEREEDPPGTTDIYDSTTPLENIFETSEAEEETKNGTLLDYTEDSDGYLLFPGIGYFKLHSEELSWYLAHDQCLHEGGDLAIPDSEEKLAVLMKLYEMHPDIPAKAVLRQQAYIGIQDPEDKREFVTVKGNPVSLDVPIWAEGEPDNQDPGKEDCVTFRTDARIRDVPCHFYLPFFCEKPL